MNSQDENIYVNKSKLIDDISVLLELIFIFGVIFGVIIGATIMKLMIRFS